MTLVLRWRVPAPRIVTRWRGPAGLAEAVEREPLYPVAAVVGPPGSGGDAVFPPLAVQAGATAPMPSGGAGSAIWSTVLNEPMFWDSLAWRTIAHFANEGSVPDVLPPPENTALPMISGPAWVGEMLTASSGSWTNSPSSFAYQWRADGIDIGGAASSTYLLTENELGAAITVAVIAANAGGESDEAVSNATAEVVAEDFRLDFTTGSLPTAVTLTRATGPATWFDSAGLMQATGSANVARFDHDPATLAPRGLMVEPAATNLLDYSDIAGAGWANDRVTTVVGQTSPTGASDATLITDAADTNDHLVRNSETLGNATYTASIFVKKGTLPYAGLMLHRGSSVYHAVLIDLGDGGVADTSTGGSTTGAAHTIEEMSNGFYRISVTINVTSGTGSVTPRCFGADSATPSWSGNQQCPTYSGAGKTWIAWGGQLETGTVPTSMVETAGSTATRAADVLTVTVPAGYSSLLITYDDGSTGSVACDEGPNVYTAADFARHRIKSMEGVA